MDKDLLQLLHNCIFGPEMKVKKMHSHGVSTWAQTRQGLIICSYGDAVKSSWQMAKPKWHLLHKHLCWPETWNNYGGQMDQLKDSKMSGVMFYGYKNYLVIYQDFGSNIKCTCFTTWKYCQNQRFAPMFTYMIRWGCKWVEGVNMSTLRSVQKLKSFGYS